MGEMASRESHGMTMPSPALRTSPTSSNRKSIPFLQGEVECSETSEKMDREFNASENRKITFSSVVSIMDIPSRDSYSIEERQTIWIPSEDLKQLTEKNLLEFAAEGWFWQNVVEEDGMVLMNGVLMHPIHLNPMLKEALRRQLPYPRAVTPPDEEMISNDGYIPADPVDRPSSPFVETVFDQNYSSDEDDDMLLEDPDAYLRKRFAHHRRPRDNIPFGDSEDSFITQLLYSDQASHAR